METWAGFEELAAKILEELQPEALVTLDDHIFGLDSETKRQIDVSIRAKIDGQDILTIVQAKDTGRSVNLVQIGEFSSVIRDVRATKGIMICRRGFSSRTKIYARNLGIELVNIHDAQSRKWRLDLQIPILWVDLLPTLEFESSGRLDEGDTVLQDERGFFYMSSDGGETVLKVIEGFENSWNRGELAQGLGERYVIPFQGQYSLLVVDRNDVRQWREVRSWQLIYMVSRRAWLGYFAPNECRGLLKYNDAGEFIVSHLPRGQIPQMRDNAWTEIDNPEDVAVSLRGTFVTTQGFQVEQGVSQVTEAYARLQHQEQSPDTTTEK